MQSQTIESMIVLLLIIANTNGLLCDDNPVCPGFLTDEHDDDARQCLMIPKTPQVTGLEDFLISY